ncbi:MAG: EAL domain-containing protein [Saccharofermentanales bacterium]
MKYDLILSIIFYVCSCFYVIFSAYLVVNNVNNKVNRLFVILTSSMVTWTLAYSIANSAPTAEVNIFWRCVSVFGWGIFYSVLLHFVLLLTKTEIRLNKRTMLAILYLPSVINIILYAPFGLLGKNQYQVVKTDFGWIDILPLDMGKLWINLYPVLFTVPSIILIIRWRRNLESHSLVKRQATIFLITVIAPFIVGGTTDILPDILGTESYPKIASIFITVPVTTLFLASKRYGLFLEKRREVVIYRETELFADSNRLRLFETAAAVFIVGAFGAFFTGYFIAGGDLTTELLLAFFVFLLGMSLVSIPHIVTKRSVQNTLFLIISIAGMTAFMITGIDKGAVTVWAVYVVFLLYTVVLNSNIHAILFFAATLITQVVIGIARPKASVIVDSTQYLKRIFIIALSYYAVRYLSTEYALKIKGYRRFSREQGVLEKISSSFISISKENAEEKIDEMLEMSAEILDFSHACLVEFSKDYKDATILNTYVKSVESESFPFQPGMKVKTATLPMAQSMIERNTPIMCEDVAIVTADESEERRDFFLSRGVNSFFALPVTLDEKTIGMLITEYSDRCDTNFRESRLNFLKIVANILGDARKKTLYEEMLYNFAYFDETTKLANRNMLKKRLEQIIDARKGSEKIAVLGIEIENLRMIKDTFGHDTGEQIMIEAAKNLDNLLENCCDISRKAEGEFVVVLPDAENTKQIKKCAKRLLDSFSHPVSTRTGIEALFVVVHMGISIYPDDGRDADTLLKNTDLAVYQAKNTNEDIVFYTELLESNIAETTLFTNRLFKSLQNEEFFLEFQPQINCETGQIVGIEALLRWTVDGTERVPPDRFIPILEHTGLIYDVGLWVLEQALQEHNRLIAKGYPPLRVSVNLSVVQFQREEFIPDFAKIIEESGADPKYIELEITESLFSKDPEDVLAKIYKLKDLGVRIAIDDFGKGYSSLSRLKIVPFDRIKIDKEIIDYIDLDRKTAPITEIIILLGNTFKAGITAEGVETKEQADFLKSIDCDEIQGFYYSMPLSTQALEEFLKINKAGISGKK